MNQDVLNPKVEVMFIPVKSNRPAFRQACAMIKPILLPSAKTQKTQETKNP
jgi:hypothetical protein